MVGGGVGGGGGGGGVAGAGAVRDLVTRTVAKAWAMATPRPARILLWRAMARCAIRCM